MLGVSDSLQTWVRAEEICLLSRALPKKSLKNTGSDYLGQSSVCHSDVALGKFILCASVSSSITHGSQKHLLHRIIVKVKGDDACEALRTMPGT